ncbi:Rho GTPase-activating protein 39 [Hypsizygus marmoreus]|uniref:Rho GTPase-activating protein 39 n=1 Tax=Hypsizygus marmoreus TaxID=39966 RepID=A0A369K037_HYPMA|nr:Rho GTPase-activating protein 39 [Hypsizygus marmoreus]
MTIKDSVRSDVTTSASNRVAREDTITMKTMEETYGVGEVPEVRVSRTPRPEKSSTPGQDGDDAAWGSNFWVTLVDPQTQTSFFACPATGQVSWDAPIGNFVLPPSEEGEWWELCDESRGGLSYYYQTKTGETVWERPEGFVIPLGIIQNTALGRRLSQTTRFSKTTEPGSDLTPPQAPENSNGRRSRRPTAELIHGADGGRIRQSQSSRSASGGSLAKPLPVQRSYSGEPHIHITHASSSRPHNLGPQLTPIPGSDASAPSSPSKKSLSSPPLITNGINRSHSDDNDTRNGKPRLNDKSNNTDSISRSRVKSSSYISHKPPQPQSLSAAVEKIATSHSDSGHGSSQKSPTSTTSEAASSASPYEKERLTVTIERNSPTKDRRARNVPPSPRRPIPAVPNGGSFWSGRNSAPTAAERGISGPIPNHAATLEMSPVKNRANGQPIPVQPRIHALGRLAPETASLNTGTYPILPADLATDIQQFSESEFARQYFSTHRTGFIFRRKVPVTQMMTWQKAPLNSPLLTLNRSLSKNAVKVFKVIQLIMGDREREKAPAFRSQLDNQTSLVGTLNGSTASLTSNNFGVLEEERWLLGEGLAHGELRDEIYCQLMKQLTGNPSTESVFKGWQLLCVLLITFPPSKNFETYLSSFIQQHTTQQEGRVDVMTKYCLRRLAHISKKGPRGKSPTTAEIETASDAAFHPSTFGESLDAIIRLQERKYPQQKVPIILPFLADGILALGGPKSEGIFRVPGDGDSVSELKLRIDRGYYTTDGVNDPHVLASLMKLWLRELCDPLVPEEMYNECITSSKDADACVRIIERLPTINRRVVLFVISFLQLFLEEKVQSVTKMTPANLALVMAPNLLRCNSDSMSVVFTNAQYEQIFVYNLLLHLQCGDIDPNYIPVHGLGAGASTAIPRVSKSRSRRP